MKLVTVAGAGGFIGGHLIRSLLSEHFTVRAVDIQPISAWHQCFKDAENLQLNLEYPENCRRVANGCSDLYNFAANMGGMGFIELNKAACMMSVVINSHLLDAAKDAGVERYLFASSACVYPLGRQGAADIPALKESDAYPADPEDGYGWEKLFSERMCRHFREDFGILTRIPRYHNVYGPHGTYSGGREKAPAAICRKVIEAKLSGNHEIEIWGDGEQTRSFQYIDDCVHGTQLLMNSDYCEPLNIGSAEMVTINQLVDLAEQFAGIKLKRRYNLDAPKGVRGRSSDNTLIRELFDWEPSTPLRVGLEKTYAWIWDEMQKGPTWRDSAVNQA